MKLVSPPKEHLEKHYEDLSDKPFYKGLVTCMQPPKQSSPFYTTLDLADIVNRHVERSNLRHGLGGP